ncbi:MAG: MFS transporter [Paralcaligenes sp.]
MSAVKAQDVGPGKEVSLTHLVVASSIGTLFEWYDLIVFGALAPVIAEHFFTPLGKSLGLVFALLLFGIAYLARPIGAAVFGHIGDVKGRKVAFVMTVALMGVATFIIGLVPSYGTIGIAAPLIITVLRFAQGISLGGEYGGAVTYLAEHAPAGRRGLITSWLQTTGPMGLLMGLLVILATRLTVGEDAFKEWGWRIPFLISIFLLAISVWLRIKLAESPVFKKMQDEGRTSKRPLSEIFGNWSKLKIVLLGVFGFTSGLGVIWYTTLLYTLLFMTQSLGVSPTRATILVSIAIALGMPLFVVAGAISDKIGRKKLIFTGLALSTLMLFPVFMAITHYANPQLEKALANFPVTVEASPGQCHFQLDVSKTKKFVSSCDIVRSYIVKSGINYSFEALSPDSSVVRVKVGQEVLTLAAKIGAQDGQGNGYAGSEVKDFLQKVTASLQNAGYPDKSTTPETNDVMIVLLVLFLVALLSMSYGPTAAMLSEMFAARTRYSEMSLAYHIGTGWFGGFLPSVAFALVVATGNIYAGLWYPVAVTLVTVLLGGKFLKETLHRDIEE